MVCAWEAGVANVSQSAVPFWRSLCSLQAPPSKVKFQIVLVVKVLTFLQWRRVVSVHDGENFLSNRVRGTRAVAETAASKGDSQQPINQKGVEAEGQHNIFSH